jgi:hypothetical protein
MEASSSSRSSDKIVWASKVVEEVDKKGSVCKEYASVKEAAAELKLSESNLYGIIRQNKRHLGKAYRLGEKKVSNKVNTFEEKKLAAKRRRKTYLPKGKKVSSKPSKKRKLQASLNFDTRKKIQNLLATTSRKLSEWLDADLEDNDPRNRLYLVWGNEIKPNKRGNVSGDVDLRREKEQVMVVPLTKAANKQHFKSIIAHTDSFGTRFVGGWMEDTYLACEALTMTNEELEESKKKKRRKKNISQV